MAQLNTKIRLFLKENGKVYEDEFRNYTLEDNDSGITEIISWNVSGLAQPTSEQLDSYNASATTQEKNISVIANRKFEYGTSEHQIENIIENGLEAEQARVQAIKDKYPKE